MKKVKKIIKRTALWKAIRPLYDNFRDKKRYNYQSYSQMGEDIIVLNLIGITNIDSSFTYLDIGANDPIKLSNTFLFYNRFRCKGVLVEANPLLIKRLKEKRRRDVVLNVGMSGHGGMAPFYIMDNPVLSTFSHEEAYKMKKSGQADIRIKKDIPLITFDTIIEKYFDGKCPDLVSLDVEGIEIEILMSIDFKKYRPKYVILETIDFLTGQYDEELILFMANHQYTRVAWTRINSIFVDEVMIK